MILETIEFTEKIKVEHSLIYLLLLYSKYVQSEFFQMAAISQHGLTFLW